MNAIKLLTKSFRLQLHYNLREIVSRRVACLLPIMALFASATAAFGTTIFGVDAANNLVRFNSATPGTLVSTQPIQGLAVGEIIEGLDFRPVDGTLFALGSTDQLYTIDYVTNPTTATATPVGNAGQFSLNGGSFGFDFNPVVDRLRVVSDTDQNIRVNPNNGTLAGSDTALAYASGDPNVGADPNVVGSAYTNNVNGATTTTLFAIDYVLNDLVRQGGVDVPPGSPSPNTGQLFSVGPLGVDVGDNVGFDIEDVAGVAYMAATVGGLEKLYTVNLGTGAATLVGQIGAGTPLLGIAAARTEFTATLVGTTVAFDGSAGANSIVFDQSGGLLRHNRWSAGDSGFNSDFDFDPSTPGDQTLSATNPAVTVNVNGGGFDDSITIGSASAPASALAATFRINGAGGGDTLTVNDTADSTARTVLIESAGFNSAIGGFGGPISYGTLENVNVNGGTGGDTFQVFGTTAARTNINAGGGNDTVSFFNGASLSGGLVDGGSGNNTLDYSAYTTQVIVDLSPAQTQTLFFATLTAQQESGPLSNSPASGQLTALLNAAQTALTFNVSYQGLTGSPISGTHFHNQTAGVNGPIVRGLFPSEQNGLVTPSGTFAGVWSNSDPTADPPDPAAPGAPVRPLNAPSSVTPGSTLVQELLAGRIYFDIHTLPNFPSGEIRGQLVSQGLANPATGTGGVRGFDNITGGSGGDSLTGNANVNILRGGPGNDTLVGGQGGDQLFGDDNDDVLIWNNGDGSDFMEGGAGSNDIVQVNGSPTGGDQFLIQVNPADPTRLRFDRTNLGLFNLNIGTVERLDFNTLGGADTTTVEFAGGNPIPVNGLFYEGGTETDRLVLQRSSGNYLATSEIHNATGLGSGTITATGGGQIHYTGLEPVDDTVPVTNFTFNASFVSSQIQVVNGPTVSGFATGQINDNGTGQFELINFARKENVTINSSPLGQVAVINLPALPTGLATLTLNTGNDDDDIDVLALASGIVANVNASGSGDFVRIVGAGIASGAFLQLNGSNGFDHLIYESGGGAVSTSPGPGAGQTTISRQGSGSVIYESFEDVRFDTGAPTSAQLLNISTRMRVETGENVLIGGFIISGTEDKKVIVRALGPSLAASGLLNTLPDPVIELYGPNNVLIASNDNWRDTQQTDIQNSGVAPQNDAEAAIVATLPPDGYTVIVRDKNGATGTAIVEGYDLDTAVSARFANISTRGFVQTGQNVMIGGFILGNNGGSTRVVIRGLGPSLAQSEVTNALADPTIDLYDSNGTRIIFNDDWMDNFGQAVQLSANGLAPSHPDESGIFTTLAPGSYTVILAGANGGTGVGVIEIYDLQ